MLNTAVENRIAPKLGTVERQRVLVEGSPGRVSRHQGVGMPKASGGQRLLSQRGANPTAHWEDMSTPRAECTERRKPPSGPIC